MAVPCLVWQTSECGRSTGLGLGVGRARADRAGAVRALEAVVWAGSVADPAVMDSYECPVSLAMAAWEWDEDLVAAVRVARGEAVGVVQAVGLAAASAVDPRGGGLVSSVGVAPARMSAMTLSPVVDPEAVGRLEVAVAWAGAAGGRLRCVDLGTDS